MSPNKNFKIKDHLLPLPSPKLTKVWNMSLEIATEVKGLPVSNYVQIMSWPSACLCQKLSIKWPATKSLASRNTSLAGRQSPQVDKAVGGATKRPASANTSLAEQKSPRVGEAVGGATKRLASANMSLAERRSPRVGETVGRATMRPASANTSLAERQSPPSRRCSR